jgi:tetratricopeptide (TPR) repeat protein
VGRERKEESLFWTVLFGLSFLFSLALALQISYRILNLDPDFVSFLAFVGQWLSILAIVGFQTNQGKELVERVLAKIGIEHPLEQRDTAILSAIALLLLLALYLFLPTLARYYYNDRGVDLLTAGQVSEAAKNFRRAVSLNPDYAEAHYNLASAYEEVLDFDRAIYEYQVALEKHPDLYAIYNNLGRLYIRQKNDYDGAIYILRRGQARISDDRVLFIVYKNLGWAHYEKGLYVKAIEELQRSLEIQHRLERQLPGKPLKLTESYRLLALAYEKLHHEADAIREWEHSLGYADLRDSQEAEWAEEARHHLEKLRGGGSR